MKNIVKDINKFAIAILVYYFKSVCKMMLNCTIASILLNIIHSNNSLDNRA